MNKYKICWCITYILGIIGLINIDTYAQKKESKPNIVLILSDDAGYADFSFMGDRFIKTPNIDYIANNGVKFTDAYVTAAVCSPSRAGMLTGINQATFGHVFNFVQNRKYNIQEDEFGIPLNQKLIGDYLRPLGYKSGIIGKWHEGFSEKFRPQSRGFDYFWGFLWGSSPYFTGKAKLVEEQGVPIEADEIPYMTDAIGNKTVEFIEKNADQPFFVYVSFNAPHTPMQAKPEVLEMYKGKFDTEGRALNAAMTHTMDENVGKILRKLEELDILNNTLVIFTNDNGGQINDTFADNYPLRGAKGSNYEGGIRVPMAMMWNGHIPKGIVSNSVVSTLDFLPTFLSLANSKQKLPRLEGIDLVALTKNNAPAEKRTHYWYLGNTGGGINGAIRSGDWKLLVMQDQMLELYNLKTDVGEQNNLYTKERVIAQRLLKQYNIWKKKLPVPLWIPIVEDPKP